MAIKKASKTKKPEKIKLKVGQVYKTRDGHRARVLAKLRDERGTPREYKSEYPFVVVVYDALNGDTDDKYTRDGRLYAGDESPLDLVKLIGFDRIL